MKFIFVCTVALGLCGASALFAQQQEDPDMTAYRIRNAGAVAGWVPQDGIGPALLPNSKPTPTGATIGNSNNANVNNGPVAGWVPQDGLGPALLPNSKPKPTGATIGGRRNYGPVPGWVPRDGLGPALMRKKVK